MSFNIIVLLNDNKFTYLKVIYISQSLVMCVSTYQYVIQYVIVLHIEKYTLSEFQKHK